MTDMADREFKCTADGDSVLAAYVAKYGHRPCRLKPMLQWDDGLNVWRSAWQEATLIEREACAVVCDEQAKEPECPERAKYCADEIRARTKP